jgi:hypothetical protein
MTQYFKSLIRCSWVLSLFSVEQLTRTLSAPHAARPAQSLDAVTRAAEAQFGGEIKALFQTGERWQRGLVDQVYDALTPSGALRVMLDGLEQSAAVVSRLVPGREQCLAWQEAQRKLRAFNLFEQADAALDLSALVARAAALGPHLAVWAIEGVGHVHTERAWREAPPQRLLNDEHASDLPVRSLIPLHTGMGLSLAHRVLERLAPHCSDSELSAALAQFVALCCANARAGYEEAALEALGLVTRNLYPQLTAPIDRCLAANDQDLLAYFWHGVGRALYFAPTNFLPCAETRRRAVQAAFDEPPHELGRRNALAGLAWALTLVNLEQPEIIEAMLRQEGERLSKDDAFANGVGSALAVWCDAAPDDPALAAFYQHQPATEMAEQWRRQAQLPAAEALQGVYPALKAQERLGELFRYQAWPAQR